MHKQKIVLANAQRFLAAFELCAHQQPLELQRLFELVTPSKEAAGKEGISLKMKVQENFTENKKPQGSAGKCRTESEKREGQEPRRMSILCTLLLQGG